MLNTYRVTYQGPHIKTGNVAERTKTVDAHHLNEAVSLVLDGRSNRDKERYPVVQLCSVEEVGPAVRLTRIGGSQTYCAHRADDGLFLGYVSPTKDASYSGYGWHKKCIGPWLASTVDLDKCKVTEVAVMETREAAARALAVTP